MKHGHCIAAALLVALCAAGCSNAPQNQEESVAPPPAAQPSRDDPEVQAEIERLEAIGYLPGIEESPVFNLPERPSGVTRLDETKAMPGLNFYLSAHEPGALLLDMRGEVLHKWHVPFHKAWPERTKELASPHAQFWRHAELLPNGDVIAVYSNLGMVRVDKDSRLVWRQAITAHHAFDLLPDGSLYALARTVQPRLDIEGGMYFANDMILLMNAETGEILRDWSVFNAFQNSPYASLLTREQMIAEGGDIFHTNTIEVLDGSAAEAHPAFTAGRFLISMRNLDLIAVLDPGQNAIVWIMQGVFKRQHEPQILDGERLLLFDNVGKSENTSRLLEFDLKTGEIVWEFSGSETQPFFTASCGAVQRLPNGNTLAIESNNGRVIELTKSGEIVWEIWNPFRAENGTLGRVMNVRRMDPGFVNSWLNPSLIPASSIPPEGPQP